MYKPFGRTSFDKISTSWLSALREYQDTFQSLRTISSRLSLIVPRNCGVLNSLPEFPYLLQSTHIELCETLLASLHKQLFNLCHIFSITLMFVAVNLEIVLHYTAKNLA